MLEVAHQDDFLVGRVELVAGGLEAALEFVPSGGGGGGEFLVAELSDEVERRFVVGGVGERLFAVDAAACRAAVAAVSVDQPVFGHLTQPQVKRHDRVLQILLQAAIGVDHHLLHDVACVDTTFEHLVHPQINHPPHSVAVSVKQLIDSSVITFADVVQELLGVFGVGPHGSSIATIRWRGNLNLFVDTFAASLPLFDSAIMSVKISQPYPLCFVESLAYTHFLCVYYNFDGY